MATISHNTELMREWSTNMDEKANNYDELVASLYNLVHLFAGSEDFKGGLSEEFTETVENQRAAFERYSSTFAECTELIRKTATNIDSDEAELKGAINSANPLA
jgi:uncharacterized protein YukE